MSSISKISCVTLSVKYLSLRLLFLLHSNIKCFSLFTLLVQNLHTRSSSGALGLLYLPVPIAGECALILRRVNRHLVRFGISNGYLLFMVICCEGCTLPCLFSILSCSVNLTSDK